MLFIFIYPNLVLINYYWHKYVTSRRLSNFFEDNKSSHTIVSVGGIVMTLHIKIVELKGERKVENIKYYGIKIN